MDTLGGFFREVYEACRTVRGTDVSRFFNMLCKNNHEQNWCTPYPGSILKISYDRPSR